MGCLLVVIALILPRTLMVFIWLLTDWFSRAYEGALLPVLGFLFMPYTTLAYMAAMIRNHNTLSPFWAVVVVIAALVDISHWGSTRAVRRRRARRRLRP
ncbi:MAG: hypothetical protein ACYS5V_11625 [Planctomycetota bacterium]|jgi:hypothetical protein